MATGNVYLFNTTANSMALLLNNHILTVSLPGVTSSNGYTPTNISAARNPASGNPGTATFGGQNVLIVSFPDGSSQQYNVDIPLSSAPITQDLQLYLFFNQVVLVINGDGTNINPQSAQVIQGQPVSVDIAALQNAPTVDA
ncbi:hypothetical protein [Longimicrobium sp.]|uniref:hypothetical protein n=1 Tax=Longimicrobium sp. TaxID=2029185 RepID=UPI002E344B9B|nr:hypothetical protein [Longimicrobium sp.]HEX6038058.1 hypothetical protein [Longimicrobium sp.]